MREEIIANIFNNDKWLTDIIIDLGSPIVLSARQLIPKATAAGHKEMDVRRKLCHALRRSGYSIHRNSARKDGRWRFGKYNRGIIYIKVGTSDEYKAEAVQKYLFALP